MQGRHKKEHLKTDEERCTVSVKRMEAIKHIYNDMLDAAPYSVLCKKLQQDAYGLGYKYCDSESYEIIRQARKLLQSDFKEYAKDAREQIWASVMDLATESKQLGDRKTSLDCFKYIGKLLGLEEAQKLDVNLTGDVDINFGFN